MSNVCDYIKWRGDLELKDFEFNEIDNLILTRLAYFPFEMLINKWEEISITELSQRFKKADKTKIKVLWPEDNKLIPLLGNSERFGKIIATNFVNKINREQEKQFSAITLLLPDNTIFVSYRGTDDTLIGWKEDFNMSFKSHVASQLDAVEYLNNVASKYENKIRVGGHSKGGNLAVYASIFAKSDVKNRIINIYNNDEFLESIKISFKNEDISSSKNDVNNVVNNTTNNNTVNNNTTNNYNTTVFYFIS